MPTTVYVQDVSNRRVHKRIREDGVRGLYSLEADNLDTSGAYIVLTSAEMERVEPDQLCRRCFARDEGVPE
jgi:hypothetical protein